MNLDAERMVNANIALDVCGVILTLIPIFYLLSGKRYKQRLNQYFLGICVSNIFMIFGNLTDWMFQSANTLWEKRIVLLGSALFYAASALVLYFFACYIVEYMHLGKRSRSICLFSVSAACAVQLFFALSSPFTGAYFYVTRHGYQRGEWFIISQLIPLYCYFLFAALVVSQRRKLTWRDVTFFLLYIFVPLGGGAVQMLHRGIAVVNIGVSSALLFIFIHIQFENEIVLRMREKELTEQNIDIMLSQIQPHFLYNSLGAIYHLCEVDPANAKTAIQKFSDFLRANMDSLKSREPIPFEKELDHVMNFLYPERQRFGGRLRVSCQIEERGFLIPPLTLQPLVENAIQHGILHRKEGGTIQIRTEKLGRCFLVTIADDGVGIVASGQLPNLGNHAHIGISNVRSRLQEMVHGSLEIRSSSQGTTVTMWIPQ